MTANSRPRVAVIGGGLAGMAAAIRIAESAEVHLFEAKSRLAGHAGSFFDAESGQWFDYCQHVSMGCCTNLADFLQRTGIADQFQRYRQLFFVTSGGKLFPFRATPLLPAPLHLVGALGRMKWLSWRERRQIATALLKLARRPGSAEEPSVLAWLRETNQSPEAIRLFWETILISALGETLDRAGFNAARRVMLTGFLANRGAWHVLVPRLPLAELFGVRAVAELERRGVTVHRGRAVRRLVGEGERITALELGEESPRPFDGFVLAVPWRQAATILTATGLSELLPASGEKRLAAAPITGIHFELDRPLTTLPHAVLLGGKGHWLFVPPFGQGEEGTWRCQVVISASRSLAEQSKEEVIREIFTELQSYFPAGGEVKLLRGRVVTEHDAVFSPAPGSEALRPPQQTMFANLALAGDWTRTGWPATMEGAVRSGYAAAEVLLAARGLSANFVQPELPRGLLARWLIGSRS